MTVTQEKRNQTSV